VPAFTSSAAPALCTSITLDLECSLGANTHAVILMGTVIADLPTAWDGHLLLLPGAVLPIVLPPAGVSLPATVPCDNGLCGLKVLLQALEMDPGASRGVSFTPGLELTLGN